ncbi:type I restriction enzyme HsdR N-terminal domain-containing protein [Flammeovirga sp. MY04]|uniref:type I restriction enzyme HsdR N-terminal domain-containing protein n=1 Tax=Flammeovirga sp. MY04 TaxID=1191459 RepID=UPI00080630A5|nr:type I restriction enzyme HsdR N-terminal domain-containing protein [Flammeovirga sp. MY04]ANQ48278.1 type I restriction enzyme HsdR N-terminal domain-containing protein [Flammeovirga sp. MY04]
MSSQEIIFTKTHIQMKWLSKGLKDKVIKINKRTNEVTYLPHQKTRSLNNPEEKVQLETFLKVIYELGYPASHVRVCVPVKMGSSTKEADIIGYNDEEGLEPTLIVECKKKGVSRNVLMQAVHQGFSYAAALMAHYVWTTDGANDYYHEVLPHKIGEREKNVLPAVPKFNGKNSFFFKIRKRFFRSTKGIFSIIGKSLKNTLFIHSLIYISFLFITFFGSSKLLFININKILATPIVEKMWYTFKMDFSWFYVGLSFLSILFIITLSNIISFFPALGNNRLKWRQKLLITFFMTIPIWVTVKFFSKAWWNWDHYLRLGEKTWMFLQPHLLILPVQFIIIAGILALPKKKNRRKRK